MVPGEWNLQLTAVIPTLLLRHFTGELEERMKTIAQELGLTIAIDRWMDEALYR